MTLNGVMTLSLRYFTEFGTFRGAVRRSGWRCRKKVHVRCLISWWVSCCNMEPRLYIREWYHSNDTRAPIANPPNSAQLKGTLTIPPRYIRVRAV